MPHSPRFAVAFLFCFCHLPGAFAKDAADASAPLSVKVHNDNGVALMSGSGSGAVSLTYGAAYQQGDAITVTAPPADKYLVIQVDDKLAESMVYSPTSRVDFPIPIGAASTGYDPAAFVGAVHHIKARIASDTEIGAYRNVAMNSLDQRGISEYYPHAIANSVTRNDPVFFERNAIDGNTLNTHHGKWPYESWGNNKDPHPTLKIDFGRDVTIDKVRLYIRADFPHDTYWSSMTILFSNGTSKDITLQKTAQPQEFTFPAHAVKWVELTNFKQVSTPLGWASITEMEVYGRDTVRKH